MFVTSMEILSWGVAGTIPAVITGAVLEFDIYTLRNVVLFAFICGCITGYTGQNIINT